MRLSVLPTLNQLVLSLDRYDQAIADIRAGKLEAFIATQQLSGAALEACQEALLADLAMRRAQVLREIEDCGVQVD